MYSDLKREVHAESQESWRANLRKAADIVMQRGLAQGMLEDGEGRVCMLGAVNVARLGRAMNGDTMGVFHSDEYYALAKLFRGSFPSKYNDEMGRTAKEVADKLRAASKMEVSASELAEWKGLDG